MRIHRLWAMPNKDTFKIKPIKDLLNDYIDSDYLNNHEVIDPFSNGETDYANHTNDLNSNVKSDCHEDALDYLKSFPDNFADIVLYDPPYSPRQVSECYHNVGIKVTQESTQASWRKKHLDEVARVLKNGGKCISFGWNTNGVGKKRGFVIQEILLVAHGGSHNDTLVTVDQKEVRNIAEWRRN